MPLSVKLTVYIALIAIAGGCVLAVFSYSNIERRMATDTEHTLEALEKILEPAALYSAQTKTQRLAKAFLSGLVETPEIACASIDTPDFTVIEPMPCPYTLAGRKTPLFAVNAKMPSGVLTIYPNEAYFIERLSQEWRRQRILLFIVTLVLMVSILIATYFLVSRPLARLSKKLRWVHFDGEVKLLPEGGRSDEFGVISRRINYMLASAKKQIIHERHLTERAKELGYHFRLIFELSKNYLAVTDSQLRLKAFNPKFKKLVSYKKDISAIENTDKWLSCVSNDPVSLRRYILELDEYKVPVSHEVVLNFFEEGNELQRYFSVTIVKGGAGISYSSILFFITDITEDKLRFLETEYEASHDNLTGLYSRLAATRQIRKMLEPKSVSGCVAFVFIDLDGFKLVNDQWGHEAGDSVLKVVSEQIRHVIRRSDIACRWGGDEFLIALSDVDAQQAKQIGEKILSSIVEPIEFDMEEHQFCQIGASIGIALSSDECRDFQTLFERADKTMYQVKKHTKNAVLLNSEL